MYAVERVGRKCGCGEDLEELRERKECDQTILNKLSKKPVVSLSHKSSNSALRVVDHPIPSINALLRISFNTF